jgi:hypothetical protein
MKIARLTFLVLAAAAVLQAGAARAAMKTEWIDYKQATRPCPAISSMTTQPRAGAPGC